MKRSTTPETRHVAYSRATGSITPEQVEAIEGARRNWFAIFNGTSGYDYLKTGPRGDQIDRMSQREASELIRDIDEYRSRN